MAASALSGGNISLDDAVGGPRDAAIYFPRQQGRKDPFEVASIGLPLA